MVQARLVTPGSFGLRAEVAEAVSAAREAAPEWADQSVENRLRVLRRFRHRLADNPQELAATVDLAWRANRAETLTAEVLPLLDACRYLERRAEAALGPRHLGRTDRPGWLVGCQLQIRRDPLGVVLIIGPSNYPVLLPGVQLLQALTAGNAVLLKPGRGARPAALYLREALVDAGTPSGCVQILLEDAEDADQAIEAGVDKVVLTGSESTGRAVQHRLAEHMTPSVMELSGCDLAIVRDDADLDLAARAIAFGTGLNAGFTCIAPRRVLASEAVRVELEQRLAAQFERLRAVTLPSDDVARLCKLLEQATRQGARMVAGTMPRSVRFRPILLTDLPLQLTNELCEVPAPVASLESVSDDAETLLEVSRTNYRLGLSIFGRPAAAHSIARRADVGVVVVNDMIVPTADPRLPFSGRGASGFGTTRGIEGLLEFTAVKAVVTRSGTRRPHYTPLTETDTELFTGLIRTTHGSTLPIRLRGARGLLREAARRLRRGKGRP